MLEDKPNSLEIKIFMDETQRGLLDAKRMLTVRWIENGLNEFEGVEELREVLKEMFQLLQ